MAKELYSQGYCLRQWHERFPAHRTEFVLFIHTQVRLQSVKSLINEIEDVCFLEKELKHLRSRKSSMFKWQQYKS